MNSRTINNYTELWFCNTTAEDESNYFSGEVSPLETGQIGVLVHLEAGSYRIIDGELYRISDNLPKTLDK